MKPVMGLAVATALLVAVGMVGGAEAQQSAPSQGPWGDTGSGYMMGPGMMGANGMMNNGTMGSWMMGWDGHGSSMCAMMTSHIEGRFAYLKTELKITDAQSSLWNAYASAMRNNSQAMATHCTAMMSQASSTGVNVLDRLDQHEQFMAAQLEALRATNKALKPLYDSFSDTQKQTANQILGGPMGMM